MLNTLWIILIFIIGFLGINLSKKINYNNYKIKDLFKKINYENLYLALGSKMGVGSLIGTTMSIFIGGPSSIIWIYIFTLLTSSIVYSESYLGSKYKSYKNSSYISGPYYYTKIGLKKNILAIILLITFLITYSIFFLMIQSNTITNTLGVNKKILLIIFIIFITLLITNSDSQIRKILNKIVPVILIFFLTISLYTIIKNITLLPEVIKLIFNDLLNTKSIFIGLVIGIKRSIFLNELLIGTTSMASGISSEDKKIVANTLVISSYFIVFVISTIITILILMYTIKGGQENITYLSLLKNTFAFHFKTFGNYFLNLIITLLASSSIISGIYIGISNIKYLTENKLINIASKLIITAFILLGIFLETTIIWKFIDTMMLMLISLNIYVVFKLKDKIE